MAADPLFAMGFGQYATPESAHRVSRLSRRVRFASRVLSLASKRREPSPSERISWLCMADIWLKLAELAERQAQGARRADA